MPIMWALNSPTPIPFVSPPNNDQTESSTILRRRRNLLPGWLRSTELARAQSPNEQLGVCIAGLNSRGGEHIRGFDKDPRTVIRAIVDIDEEVARRRADQIAGLQGTKPEVFKDVPRGAGS